MSGKSPLRLSKATAVPASVTAKIEKGIPKRLAMSTGKKTATSVKV